MTTPQQKILNPWNPNNRVIQHKDINQILQRYGLRGKICKPELFQHVPQKYLDNLLGISPESLSRIRARRKS